MTLTFLLTDLEASTRMWEQQPEEMRASLARHDEIIERLVADHHGTVVRPRGEGDSRFAVFERASNAVAAAYAVQDAFAIEPWATAEPLRVRIGLHTGDAEWRAGDYYGSDVNRCARLRGAAHGGQVVLSGVTAELVSRSLPDGGALRDLGVHLLKDLAAPERIYQLVHPQLASDFPALATLSGRRHNLRSQISSFVGRQRELAAVCRLATTTRLLTLVGAGGIGKTRLALQAAADMIDRFADGVWLVELAPLSDGSLLPAAVAKAVGAREQPGVETTASLLQHLGTRRLLLVLDNCEHLIQTCAELTEHTLGLCPDVSILATSREPLGVSGEVVWQVPPLDLPAEPSSTLSADELVASEAARLFVERASAADSAFVASATNASVIAEICRRLDGVPLALELAAPHVRSLGVSQLSARLDATLDLLTGGSRTGPARHRTLRAAIDWSSELLTPDERTVLHRLSVFVGGWVLPAAESVCSDDDIPAGRVFGLLSRLVDQSLVQADATSDEVRYRLLEPIRQYAAEQLQASNAAPALRQRHIKYFVALAEQAESELRGPRQAYWFERLECEHDNFRAGLSGAADIGELQSALRLGGALWHFWCERGYAREGLTWMRRALSQGDDSTPERAAALNGAGNLASTMGEFAEATDHYEQSLALWRKLGNSVRAGIPMGNLATVATNLGNYERARELWKEALPLLEATGERWRVAHGMHQLGWLANFQGEFEEASRLLVEEVALRRTLGTALDWQARCPSRRRSR